MIKGNKGNNGSGGHTVELPLNPFGINPAVLDLLEPSNAAAAFVSTTTTVPKKSTPEQSKVRIVIEGDDTDVVETDRSRGRGTSLNGRSSSSSASVAAPSTASLTGKHSSSIGSNTPTSSADPMVIDTIEPSIAPVRSEPVSTNQKTKQNTIK